MKTKRDAHEKTVRLLAVNFPKIRSYRYQVEVLDELELANKLIEELETELAILKDQSGDRCMDIGALRERLKELTIALEAIKSHGCCVMHNDSGCPGCIAGEVLKGKNEHKN